MGTIVQQASVQIPGNRSVWTDTGVTLKNGEILHIRASGACTFAPGEYAWPEGTYADRSTPTHGENVGDTLDYHDSRFTNGAGDPYPFVVSNTAPECLSMVILPEGQVPLNHNVDNGYRLSRDYVQSSLDAGRIWLIFNDVQGGNFANNSGFFDVTITRETDDPLPIDVGKPSPLRYCPPGLLAARQGNEMNMVWMLAIKPRRGAWEGYAEYDLALEAPEYADTLGNVTPGIIYNPVFADVSNIPTSLKLGSEGTDVKLLAPQFLQGDYVPPCLFLDRGKLIKGYYIGAYWELFQVDPTTSMEERLCWSAGEIGNCQVDDLTATIELTSYDEMANRTVGDVYHVVCQVGTRPNEEFGNGRCRNEVLNDGPLRDDWTVLATVVNPGWNVLRLSYGANAISGQGLNVDFADHLANGDVEFLVGDEGGHNAGYKGVVKSGSLVEAGVVDVTLRLSLPYLPEAGDQLHLTAGCRRTKSDCQFFNNLANMQASDLAGSDDLLRRTRV